MGRSIRSSFFLSGCRFDARSFILVSFPGGDCVLRCVAGRGDRSRDGTSWLRRLRAPGHEASLGKRSNPRTPIGARIASRPPAASAMPRPSLSATTAVTGRPRADFDNGWFATKGLPGTTGGAHVASLKFAFPGRGLQLRQTARNAARTSPQTLLLRIAVRASPARDESNDSLRRDPERGLAAQ